MALNNYTDLQASLANWLNRTDLTNEISQDFIVLAEKDFNSKLRIRKMIDQTTITLNGETSPLPSDFLQVRDMYILNGGTKYALTYLTPAQMDQIKGGSTSGQPSSYTILGDNIRFAPIPDSDYTLYLNYYKQFPGLSSTNSTNYILTNHPAIYLYGSLYHASNFLGGIEPNQAGQWEKMYQTSLERLERNDREDAYGNAPLQQQSDVTVAGAFNDKNYYATNNNG
mgnify:CR=1 FL=1